jgi:hypothetical protein
MGNDQDTVYGYSIEPAIVSVKGLRAEQGSSSPPMVERDAISGHPI